MSTIEKLQLVEIGFLRAELPKMSDAQRWGHFKKSVASDSKAFLYCKFFEVFCDPENYRLPLSAAKAGLDRDLSFTDLKAEDLRSLINPKKVKAEMLTKLGIYFELDSDKKVILTSELVSSLLGCFDKLRPLHFGPQALIRKAKNLRPSPRFWVVGSLADSNLGSAQGAVLRFNANYSVDEEAKNKSPRVSLYSDIASCLRASYSQREGSSQEIDQLIPVAQEAAILADQFWSAATVGKKRDEIVLLSAGQLILASESAMKSPLDPAKVQAKKRINAARTELDSRGRRNPAAKAFQLTAAAANLEQRADDVAGTSSFNERDLLVLKTNYLRAKQVFDGAAQRIAAKIEVFQGRVYPMFNARYKAQTRLLQLDNFLTSLGLNLSTLGSLHFRPFSTFAKAILVWRESTALIARSNNLNSDSKEGPKKILELKQLLSAFSAVYPKYLIARHRMRKESGVVDGRISLQDYIKDLKLLLQNDLLATVIPDSAAYMARVDQVLSKLDSWQPPKRRNALSYLKELASAVDLEAQMRKS
jgi:hypothetical protein